MAVSTVKVCQQDCAYTSLAKLDHPTSVSCTAAASVKPLYTSRMLGFCQGPQMVRLTVQTRILPSV